MEVQTASTPSVPSASPVILPSSHSALPQDEGNQSGADKGQPVPVVKEEAQMLHGDSQQTIGQEGSMPGSVRVING